MQKHTITKLPKPVLKLLCFCFLTLNATISLSSDPVITVYTAANDPPKSFVLPNGELSGFYVEYWRLWAEYNNKQIQFVTHKDEFDITNLSNQNSLYSADSEWTYPGQQFLKSEPTHHIQFSALVRRSSDSAALLSGQKALNIGIRKNLISKNQLQTRFPSHHFLELEELEHGVEKVLSDELDMIIAETYLLRSEIEKQLLHGVLEVQDISLKSNAVRALVAKNNEQLLNTINQGLLNIPIREIEQLEQNWFPHTQLYRQNSEDISTLTLNEQKWLEQHKNLTVGVDTSWFPYDFVDSQGQFNGISADYIKIISERLELNITPIYNSNWNETFELFQQGKIDALSAIIPTAERIKSITFSNPYFTTPSVIVTRKQSFYADSMSSLYGKSLALVKGFAIVEMVKTDHPEIDIHLVESISEGLQRVNDGEIDAYIGSLSVVNNAMDENDLQNLQVAAFTEYKFQVAMAVRKGLEPLAQILNKAIDSIDVKQRTTIANNWLAIHVSEGTELTTILVWGLPILGGLLIIIFTIVRFNNHLRNEIEKRKDAEMQLRHFATHDSLTGLMNWYQFKKTANQALLEARSHSYGLAILFLDIDHFKSINDNHGHHIGDCILQETAHRLLKIAGDHDIVSRKSGDEFIVIHTIKDSPSTDAFVQSLLNEMNLPFVVEDASYQISMSVGISKFPENGDDIKSLLKASDAAMYEVKGSGKNNYRYSDEHPHSS